MTLSLWLKIENLGTTCFTTPYFCLFIISFVFNSQCKHFIQEILTFGNFQLQMKSWNATGSFTMKCAKVKAYITPKYWLSVFKSGFWASATSGHLLKYTANLSQSNGSREMTFFSLVFQRFTVHGQIWVWKMFLAEKRSYIWKHLT